MFFRSRHANIDKKLVLRLSSNKMPTASQLKHLPKFLSRKEKIASRIFLAIFGLSAMALLGKYTLTHLVPAPTSGGNYVEAAVGGPHLVNPVLAAGNDADRDLIKLVYSGLLAMDKDGKLVPDLAESYTSSPDLKVFTLKLRNDAVWHDGVQATAADVKFTFDAIKDSRWHSPLAADFKNTAITSPDDSTIVFTLTEPSASFLPALTVGVIPQHLWQEIEPENAARAELNIKPIGTGPFKFDNFTKDKKGAIKTYSLIRFEDRYSKKPYLASLTFKYFQDFSAATEEFLAKKTDGISLLTREARSSMPKSNMIKVVPMRLSQYVGVFFNQSKNPVLASKAVRQALALAVDRGSIVNGALNDGSREVFGPIMPGFVGFDPDVKKYQFDAAAAGALLDKEGWKLDGGIRKKTTETLTTTGTGKNKKTTTTSTSVDLSLTLTTADTVDNLAVGKLIQENWQAIGVKTDLVIVPAAKMQKEAARSRDYDALLYGEALGPEVDPYPFWHSTQAFEGGSNLAGFSDKRADQLLEQARLATSDSEREKMYKEFQGILAEQVPAIFLYSPIYAYGLNQEIKGVETGILFSPADRLGGVENWYVKTKRIWQ